MKKWKTWLVIAAVFLSGVIIGSAGTGLYMKHRIGGILHEGLPAMRKVIMNKLTAELDLTADQQDEIDEIVEDTQLQLQQLRSQYRPQMENIITTGIATMKTRLSPEQQKKLDALYDKLKKRWSMRRGAAGKSK
ncbi:MAG TPA: hypothetical protein VJW95_03960 [Dissulfurispiraceae bacterium]|nr:hypothetical protein [Dissulfurispiraceae bacterium]